MKVQHLTITQALLGLVVVIAIIVFSACFVTLKNYVDTEGMDKKTLEGLYKSQSFPAFGQMTREGKVRYVMATIALLVAVLLGTGLIVYDKYFR